MSALTGDIIQATYHSCIGAAPVLVISTDPANPPGQVLSMLTVAAHEVGGGVAVATVAPGPALVRLGAAAPAVVAHPVASSGTAQSTATPRRSACLAASLTTIPPSRPEEPLPGH
jgi:hypothetical protein